MSVYLPKGCKIWQIDFQRHGRRVTTSSGETTKAAALAAEKEEKRKIDLKHMLRKQIEDARRQGLPPPPGALYLQGGQFNAQAVAEQYWMLRGRLTENANQLKGQIARAIELVGPATDLATLDDATMLHLQGRLRDMKPIKKGKRKNKTRKPRRQIDGYEPSSINDMLRLIARLRHFAVNDLHAYSPYALHPKEWLEPEPEEARELNAFEEIRLERATQRIRPELLDVWKFAIKVGVRREELCTLRWDQVDTINRKITVELKGRGRVKEQHTVFLRPSAIEILKRQENLHDEYVFTLAARKRSVSHGRVIEAGERIPLQPETFANIFRDICDEANVLAFSAVHLRHTAATRLLRSCGNLEIVRKFLGHTTDKCTKRYAKLVDEDVAGALMILESTEVAAQRRILMAMKDPTAKDVKVGLELADELDEATHKEALKQLRKDAKATTFALATAAA
jgi:integrase